MHHQNHAGICVGNLGPPPKNQAKTNVEEGEDIGIKNELRNSEQTLGNKMWYLHICILSLLREPM